MASRRRTITGDVALPGEPGVEPTVPVELHPLGPPDAPLFRTLFALYLHDLASAGADYRLDEHGIWQPDRTDFWLADRADTLRFLMHLDGKPIGFALVGVRPFPFMTEGRDFKLVEFFVLGPYRRRGVGRSAAATLFERLRGKWEISQLPSNDAAIGFWTRVVAKYTRGSFEALTVAGCPTQFFDNVTRSS